MLNNNQVYSVVKARLSNMQSFTYEGCSECHKKIEPGFVCNCSQNSKMKIYTIVKILLENEDSRLEATVFDEAIQNELMGIGEPIFVKVQIKSYKKRENPEKEQIVHIITKFFAWSINTLYSFYFWYFKNKLYNYKFIVSKVGLRITLIFLLYCFPGNIIVFESQLQGDRNSFSEESIILINTRILLDNIYSSWKIIILNIFSATNGIIR